MLVGTTLTALKLHQSPLLNEVEATPCNCFFHSPDCRSINIHLAIITIGQNFYASNVRRRVTNLIATTASKMDHREDRSLWNQSSLKM